MTDQPQDRDVVRAARLDSLSVLLTRIANGLTLTPEEARLLVEHVSVEVSESTTARAAAADLTRRDDQAEPAEPVHGCTINGQPAMPILISEYNQLVADLAALRAVAQRLDIGDAQAWCKYCRRAWNSPAHRCESDAEQRVQRIAELRDRWLAAWPPVGQPISRWVDARLAELTAVLNEEQP